MIRVEGFKCPTGIYQRCRKIVDIGGAKHLTSIWHARQIFENPICIMFSWGSRCGPQKLQQDFYTLSTRMAGFGMWQSTRGKWWLTHWASLLRWIWSISEYNLTKWYSPSQVWPQTMCHTHSWPQHDILLTIAANVMAFDKMCLHLLIC